MIWFLCHHKYFLKLPAVRLTASPSKAALGSRISSGCTEIGKARYVTHGSTASGIRLAFARW